MDKSYLEFEKYYIYQLLDVDTILSNKSKFFTVFTGYRNLQDKMVFSISPQSGFIYFEDPSLIFSDNPPFRSTQFKDNMADNVEVALRKYFADVSKRHKALFQNTNIPAYFSDTANEWTKSRATLVPHPIKNTFDHYLFSFTRSLTLTPEDSKQKAEVSGCVIDIRMSPTGKLAGLSIRWRPVLNVAARTKQYFFNWEGIAPSTDSKSAESDEDSLAGILKKALPNYQLGNYRQKFLSPYAISMDDDEGKIIPLTSYSMYAELLEQHTDDGVVLQLITIGDALGWDIGWHYWQPDRIFADGIQSLGSGLQQTLPLGVYNLIVLIRDTANDNTYAFEKMIFAKGKIIPVETSSVSV